MTLPSDRLGNLQRALESRLASRVTRQALLAPLTTYAVGGPADLFAEVRTSDEILFALRTAQALDVPVTFLGGGSNVLVGDAGVRGLVVRIHGGSIALEGAQHVRADAGVTVNGLVRWTIGRGLAGIEAWAGTPGTVGGAIFGNAHFQGALIGELVHSVRVADRNGEVRDLSSREMDFGYDRSRLQQTGEVLLSAVFRVRAGEPDALRETARESLAFRKRTQPLEKRSAGCVFQNPDPARDRIPPDTPCSAGALIDRAGLKGFAVGAARVSPVHANFIVNEGGATACDIRQLIDTCKAAVRARFGLELREEIVLLGQF